MSDDDAGRRMVMIAVTAAIDGGVEDVLAAARRRLGLEPRGEVCIDDNK